MKVLLGAVISLVAISGIVGVAYSQSGEFIPGWVKGIAGFWAEDRITDQEFINALGFLIESGIIQVHDPRTIQLENELAEHKSLVSQLKAEIRGLKAEPRDEIIEPETPEAIVLMPFGTSIQGCEATDECFIPSDVVIDVGGTVTWINDDAAAHTVTSGSSEWGPDGAFDSGLFLSDGAFSLTFDHTGEYPYYCAVHPWMAGSVTVVSGFDAVYDEKIDDIGDFYMTYESNPNSKYDGSDVESVLLRGTGLFEPEIEYLNNAFRLPYDIEIIAMECGAINAFYNPATKQIKMCYEYVDHIFETWYLSNPDDPDVDAATLYAEDVLLYILYHEVAHALIDVYDLPITGLEENVADQFATLVILHTYDPVTSDNYVGKEMLYHVGDFYIYMDEYGRDTPYWSKHALNMQRFYNTVCYTYGADREYSQWVVDEGILPENRANSCKREYDKIEQSWNHLLMKYTN